MDYYAQWDEFWNNWRFTDPEFDLLPDLVLNKIRPLSEEYSKDRWNYWISDKVGHIMFLIKNTKNIGEDNKLSNDCGWGNNRKQRLLKRHLARVMKLNRNEPITFLWDSITAVETEWGVFLEYWYDFCYPHDDSNIIIFHKDNRALIYIEDKVWVVDRQSFFGLK